MLGIFQNFSSVLFLRPSIKTSNKTLLGALANGFNQAGILQYSSAQAITGLNGILHAHSFLHCTMEPLAISPNWGQMGLWEEGIIAVYQKKKK